jgi:acyl CoA:acetate/3-ketoacid CoA transferase beta subunit
MGDDWMSASGKLSNDTREAEGNRNKDLADIARSFANETKGLRTELIDQFMDILKTGGSQAITPTISRAVEASKQATSQSMLQTQGEMARTGLAGTPFAAAVLGQTSQQGNQATARIGPEISMELLKMIPNFLMGQASTSVSGMGTSAQNETSMYNHLLDAYMRAWGK